MRPACDRSPPAPRASSAAAWVVQFPLEGERPAANDNSWSGDEPTPTVDVFAADSDAWLDWLMDFVAIESAIRRRGS